MLNWVENAFFLLHNDKTSEIENVFEYERFRCPVKWFLLFWFE